MYFLFSSLPIPSADLFPVIQLESAHFPPLAFLKKLIDMFDRLLWCLCLRSREGTINLRPWVTNQSLIDERLINIWWLILNKKSKPLTGPSCQGWKPSTTFLHPSVLTWSHIGRSRPPLPPWWICRRWLFRTPTRMFITCVLPNKIL